MESNEKDLILIEKAKFYKSNELKCHVLTIPKGTFKNGIFVSELEEGNFFWFIALDNAIPFRLFLNEIYDVQEYIEEVKE